MGVTEVDGVALRRTLGAFATGVIVITTGGRAGTRGMTANAFLSVSLDPPLVLISVRAAAQMAGCIVREGRFALSILAENQAAVARHFAGQGACAEVAFDERFGVPVVAGAVGHLVCDLHQTVAAGDHTLFIGRVRRHARHAGAPLVYCAGAYGAHAPQAEGFEPSR